jgi:hypothetical protein
MRVAVFVYVAVFDYHQSIDILRIAYRCHQVGDIQIFYGCAL